MMRALSCDYPAFCGSSPVFTWMNNSGTRSVRSRLGTERMRELRPVERMMASNSRPHRRPCCSAMANEMKLHIRIINFRAGHFVFASCTRFSPKTRCWRLIPDRSRQGQMSWDTATSCANGAGATDAFLAASMRAGWRLNASGRRGMGSLSLKKASRGGQSARTKLARVARGSMRQRSCRGRCLRSRLLTDDDRLGDPLAAMRALPRGSLVILRVRDSATPPSSLPLRQRKCALPDAHLAHSG